MSHALAAIAPHDPGAPSPASRDPAGPPVVAAPARGPGPARTVIRVGLWALGASLLAYAVILAAREFARVRWDAAALGFLSAAVALSVAAQAAMYLRWWLLLPRCGRPVPAATHACGVGFLGGLSDYALVGGLGGMTVRAAWLVRRHGVGKAVTAAGVLLDRLIGLATLLAIGAAAAIASGLPAAAATGPLGWIVPASLLAAAAAAAAVASAGMKSRWAQGRWADARSAARAVGRCRFAGAIGLSFASQLLAAGSLAAAAAALPGEPIGFLRHCTSLAVGEVAAAAAPVPGGLGVREAAMAAAYGDAPDPAATVSTGAAAGLSSRAAALAATLFGAGIYGLYVSASRGGVLTRRDAAGADHGRTSRARLRILIVANYAPPHVGGVEVLVEREARLLARAGHEVRIVTSDCGGGPPPDWPEGVRIERVPAWNVLERRFDIPWPLFSPSLIASLWRAARWCDVVHAHGFLGLNGLLAMAAARLSGRGRKRCILTEHAGRGRYTGRRKNLLQEAAVRTLGAANVRLAHDRVACHNRVRETLERLGAGPGGVRLLMFPPDRELFRPPTPQQREEARRQLGWPEGRPKVLFVGRLIPRKGVGLLLDARDDRYDLVFCGPGDPTVLGEPDGARASFLGAKGRCDLPALYHAADVLALPSYSEGNLPLVAQEALTSGLPVVLGEDPALARFRRCPGLSFAPLEPSALRAAILRAVAGGRLRPGPGADPFVGLLPNEEEWVASLLGPGLTVPDLRRPFDAAVAANPSLEGANWSPGSSGCR